MRLPRVPVLLLKIWEVENPLFLRRNLYSEGQGLTRMTKMVNCHFRKHPLEKEKTRYFSAVKMKIPIGTAFRMIQNSTLMKMMKSTMIIMRKKQISTIEDNGTSFYLPKINRILTQRNHLFHQRTQSTQTHPMIPYEKVYSVDYSLVRQIATVITTILHIVNTLLNTFRRLLSPLIVISVLNRSKIHRALMV
ncbi:hypothetical protein AWRI1631_142470 [Saccharomyces cerevisiae AWRI1631]|uniref:Uncharacterized protein orf n=2 Tax=Saccharomyces cerevisiae TaxID=4932 RepID=E9PA73_YEASX|nr:hypothetical protein AWRI1631_142470 [Saccharomyces cerevisiae AWRI1631]CAA60183.1 unknown [Saccharomyces cerevisiae]